MRPWSEACERNRDPILERLRVHFPSRTTVLEIGSGTGQHAVHFAAAMPDWTWIATDVVAHLPGIRLWTDEAGLANLHGPLALDVCTGEWPVDATDQVFSANTAHIMSWPAVIAMFAGAGRVLASRGRFALYGPFNRDGVFTSESNRRFDEALRASDPRMGIRDDVELDRLAAAAGLRRVADDAMPANNRMLIWERR